MPIILNLFREGTRLSFVATVSSILKEHTGIYDFHLTAAELMKRSADLNRVIEVGKINSMKTAESYVLNSIALGLHQKLGNKVVLTPNSKAILCLRQPGSHSFELSQDEKIVMLGLLLKIDNEGFLPLLSFLRKNGSSTVKQMYDQDNWTRIFENEKMKRLRGAARLHRLIPRLEWCVDLNLVEKTKHYDISPTGMRLLHLASEKARDPFDLAIELYFPVLKTKDTEELYEQFLTILAEAYRKLLFLMPSAYHVEILALRLLISIAFASESLSVAQDKFKDLFLKACRRNLQRMRLTCPSTRQDSQGIVVDDRLYSYMTLVEGNLQ